MGDRVISIRTSTLHKTTTFRNAIWPIFRKINPKINILNGVVLVNFFKEKTSLNFLNFGLSGGTLRYGL